MSVVPDVRGWRGRGILGEWHCTDAGGRKAVGGQHKGSCVGLHTGPVPVLSSPTQGQKTSLLSTGKYQGNVSVPLRLEILVRHGMSAVSCVFASLSPGCNSWEGRRPKASDRVANHI